MNTFFPVIIQVKKYKQVLSSPVLIIQLDIQTTLLLKYLLNIVEIEKHQ